MPIAVIPGIGYTVLKKDADMKEGIPMQNIDIRGISMGDLLCFVKAVECRSFTRAAEYFHLTQSTVSKKVASLEQQLDL